MGRSATDAVMPASMEHRRRSETLGRKVNTVRGRLFRLVLLVLVAGCAHRAPVPMKLSLGPDTDLGPIALLVHTGPVPARFGGPTTRGQGAANRALDYTATSLVVAAQDRSGVLLALAIFVSPVTATVGAIVGATEGESTAKSQPARDALARALVETDPAGALRARVLTLGRERLGKAFLDVIPAEANAEGKAAVAGRVPDNARTLLEIRLSEIRLGKWVAGGNSLAATADPFLVFRVIGRLRLVRVDDGTELFARPLEYEGATRAFSFWAEDDAQRFRAALGEAVEALAVQVVEDTF
jgi:hypothetical protein